MTIHWIQKFLFVLIMLCFSNVALIAAIDDDGGVAVIPRKIQDNAAALVNNRDHIVHLENPTLVLGGGFRRPIFPDGEYYEAPSDGSAERLYRTPRNADRFTEARNTVVLDVHHAGAAPWIQADFNKLDDLQSLKAEFGGCFARIFFDAHVTHCIKDWTVEHIKCLADVLQNEGVFIFSFPTACFDVVVPELLEEDYPWAHNIVHHFPLSDEDFWNAYGYMRRLIGMSHSTEVLKPFPALSLIWLNESAYKLNCEQIRQELERQYTFDTKTFLCRAFEKVVYHEGGANYPDVSFDPYSEALQARPYWVCSHPLQQEE